MAKVERNSPCPCGSGRKYKQCCIGKETALRNAPLPGGRFRYEPGSYGGSGNYMPSLLCYKETASGSWEEHYCLVKSDAGLEDEDSATAMATEHLNAAFAAKEESGSAVDVAISLRHEGYKNVEGFRVIREETADPE